VFDRGFRHIDDTGHAGDFGSRSTNSGRNGKKRPISRRPRKRELGFILYSEAMQLLTAISFKMAAGISLP
jgi:hypothetical protein